MSELKPYPKYKDSGVEWIGEIPEHWSVKPLFTILEEVKNKNKELKVSNVLSLSYGKITKRDIEKNYGLLPANFRNYNIVNTGYIVMRLTDLQNDKRSLRVGYVKERGVITSAYVTLSLKKRHDYYNRYLYFLLHIYDIKKIYYGLGDGVRQTMNFNDLKWLPILEYNNEETIKIALYLDSKVSHINSLIHNKKRLIELLEEKRQAIITETVTKGLNPNVEMKDSGIDWIGEIPEHWKVTKLKYVGNITMGQSPKAHYVNDEKKGLPFLQGNAEFTERYPEAIYYCDNSPRVAKKGSLLMSVRAPVGELNNADKSYAIGRGLCAIKANDNNNTDYLYYLLSFTRTELYSKMVGSTFEAVTVRDVRELITLQPPLKEQLGIVEHLNKVNNDINSIVLDIQNQISKLKEYRESLIYEAVTGKIDLRNYEPKGDIDEAH